MCRDVAMSHCEGKCFHYSAEFNEFKFNGAADCVCSVKVSRDLNFHTVCVHGHGQNEGTKRTTY